MNSPETAIYRKSYVLYNLHRARKHIRKAGRSILVEGYMDVIGLDAAGIGEAVASCGTALTTQQVRALRRHSGRIVVNFDSDTAGQAAAERSIHMLLEEGMHVRVVELEAGMDPDDYVRRHGVEGYRRRLEQAPGCFHWLADRARARFDMSTVEGRVEGLRAVMMPAIERLPDRLERAAMAAEVASYLRVDPALVRSEFRRSGTGRGEQRRKPAAEPVDPKEKLLVNLLLANPEARAEVIPRLSALTVIRRFRLWPLLKVMLQLHQGGEAWGYSDLEARLEEQDKALLASVVFADAMREQDASLEQALAFLPQLEHQERQARLAELRERVKAAERAGDIEQALRLTEELNRAHAQ